MLKIKPDLHAAAGWQAAQPNHARSGQYAFDKNTRTFVARDFDQDGHHDFSPSKDKAPGLPASLRVPRALPDNDSMETPITRPELDAKLETIEARMDGRIARIEDAVQRISEDNAATRAGISSLKTTLIVTAIGAVLTIVLGVAAFNATLQSNMLSAFQVGQQVSQQK